jgi:hypothetical protein
MVIVAIGIAVELDGSWTCAHSGRLDILSIKMRHRGTPRANDGRAWKRCAGDRGQKKAGLFQCVSKHHLAQTGESLWIYLLIGRTCLVDSGNWQRGYCISLEADYNSVVHLRHIRCFWDFILTRPSWRVSGLRGLVVAGAYASSSTAKIIPCCTIFSRSAGFPIKALTILAFMASSVGFALNSLARLAISLRKTGFKSSS